MVARNVPKARARWATALSCAALGVAAACGPSLASVHEGTVRFEHCNRLDLDQRVEKAECRKCWTTWLGEYTYGQPRDRIDYARRRAKSLANGDERPALKFDDRSAEERQFYLVVPGPTSVHAPPPPIATVVKNGDADAGALAKSADERPPAESCAEKCRTAWKACGAECSNGHGASDEHGRSPAHGGSPHAPGNGQSPNLVSNGAPGSDSKSKPAPGPAANACSSKCGGDYSTCMKRCFD